MEYNSSGAFISEIDRERFGIKTARIVGLTAENLSSTMDFCRNEQVTLLIARCDMTDLDACQSMEKKGFLLMDTLVFYRFDIAKKNVTRDHGAAVVRPVLPGEESQMISVAGESFHGYLGHYHTDSRLDKHACDEAYTDWARKAFASREPDNFLVGEVDGQVVGFGVMRINHADEGEMFLGGIRPEFQGHGIYHSFLCKGVQWCLSKNARHMVISTQLKNLSVQKVLIKFGFEIFRGYYTYHKWFDG